MHLKPYLGLVLALFLVLVPTRALAQAPPAATEARLPLAIGAGFSAFNPDNRYNEHGHLLGAALWIDYSPNRVPHMLRGIGVQLEARDLNYGRSSTEPLNLRQDVASGGIIYSWPGLRNLRPYGKFEMGFGNQDYGPAGNPEPYRVHQTRTVTSVGGGLEIRAAHSVWVRVDYEYQFWPDFYPPSKPAYHTPQGFTVGALYHFSRPHFH